MEFYPWYFDYPSIYGILTPLYLWYFDHLPMVYRPHYPWYFDPPTHGKLTLLPMLYRPPSSWYFEPLPMEYRPPPYTCYFDLPAYLLIINGYCKYCCSHRYWKQLIIFLFDIQCFFQSGSECRSWTKIIGTSSLVIHKIHLDLFMIYCICNVIQWCALLRGASVNKPICIDTVLESSTK